MNASSPAAPADDGGRAWRSADAYWRGWPEIRADLRSSARLVLVLAVAGVLAGLLWWWLAPRADFRITDTGPVVIGKPPEELLVADDTVLALILATFGLVAGAASRRCSPWRSAPRRWRSSPGSSASCSGPVRPRPNWRMSGTS